VSDLLLVLAFTLVAALYASVGHAGASGYLGAMAVAGISAAAARPTALLLNVVVATLATWRFASVPGLFRWRLFWPFAIASVPMSWLGGSLPLEERPFRLAVGVVLLFAAARMAWSSPAVDDPAATGPGIGAALASGAAIGLLSGWIGVGGGIFLSPLVIGLGWASTREASAVAAPFILVNSLAGLAGREVDLAFVTPLFGLSAAGVLLGGWIGSSYGSRAGTTRTLRALLSLVLLVAGGKLLLT
jgi:hypothetical protein